MLIRAIQLSLGSEEAINYSSNEIMLVSQFYAELLVKVSLIFMLMIMLTLGFLGFP